MRFDRRVARAPERPAGRLEARAERRRARAREGQEIGHEERERHALRLGGDLGAEHEEVPDDDVGGAALELGANVGGEQRGRPDHGAVAHARERPEAASSRPSPS